MGANMTRKDYILLAQALAKPIPPEFPGDHRASFAQESTWVACCTNIADAIKQDNPRGFDRELFLQNCGVNQ
jgi:hypothetical protein